MQEPAARMATGRVPQLAKYDLLEELGHGGMATVYRARDRRLGREVAVKVIHPHLRDSREVVSRFHAEAKAVAKLHHRNIVDVYDVSEPDETEQYLVVELVRGTTLRRLLQEQGAMPPEVAAALGLELLAAIAHANGNGVVHRDVKPENVLVERRDTAFEGGAPAHGISPVDEGATARVVVKLTDFGIAKLLDAQGVTSTGQVLGSPAHMAPEQIEGGEVDARSDVFGVGVLLYECMVGHLPFDGANPAQVLRRVLDGSYPEAQRERPLVGARWSGILDRALARAPADRYPDAGAMHEAVAAELQRLEVGAPERALEAWIDDPAAFAEGHDAGIIERLCALANDARRRGDVLSAAADYNRALAHAPADPNLLRIVAGMNRAERRGRALRRGAWVALGAAAVAAVPLAVRHFGSTAAQVHESTPSTRGGATEVVARPVASTVASALEKADGAEASVASAQTRPAHEAPHVTDRHVTLDLKPPMGVTVSVDGQPERAVSTGDSLTLGTRGHSLVFGCPVCTPVSSSVDPGERDTTLVVSVPVKPAILIIDGDVSRTYQLIQHPEIAVRAGTNSVPLRSVYEPVTVKQIETGETASVRLEAAKSKRAEFP